MRFHQAVTFLPTRTGLALAQAADDHGLRRASTSRTTCSTPASCQSRYTYSTRRGRRPGLGERRPTVARPDVPDLGHGRGHRATSLFTTGVYIAPARDLITVAKSVGTAAVLSDNRVRLGVGVGWCEEEFDQTGQDFHTRGKRLDDMIPALRALWQGGWVEYHGTYYDVPACQMEPSPTAPIPIIGGGHSAPALRRAADAVRRLGRRRRLHRRGGLDAPRANCAERSTRAGRERRALLHLPRR